MSREAESARLPVRRQVALSAYWFSLNFETASLLTIVIPAALDRLAFQAHTTTLARLAVMGSVVAMLLPPLMGSFSDRIHHRGGSRRPMLLWGTVVNVGGLFWMLSAQSVAGLTGGFVVAVLGQNAAGAAYQAMMPDIVPQESWGLASGYMGVASLLGTIGGVGVAGIFAPQVAYVAMAVVAVLGSLYSASAARGEEAVIRDDVERPKIRSRRDFYLVFAARFLVFFGQTLLMTFALYFFQDVLHVSNPGSATAGLIVLALVGAVVASIVLGSVSDRSDRPGIVFFATVPMALAVGGFAFVENVHWILLFAIVYGAGYGAYLSVDWALALDSIPDLRNVARDLGVWGIATNLPSVLAPAAGGILLAAAVRPGVGYRELFLIAGAVTLAGAFLVLFVRTRRRASFADIGLRMLVAGIVYSYVRIAYRVRIEGRLPRHRGSTLIVSNHAHDLEGMVVPVALHHQGPPSRTVYFAASERLFEPGFLATRGPAWLKPLLARLHIGKLLLHLGVRPIENMPRTRPFVGLCYAVWQLHGNLRMGEVFTDDTLSGLGVSGDLLLRDAWRAGQLHAAQVVLPFSALREPYRGEIRAGVRRRIEGQLDALTDLLDTGGTLYLTPEGRYTEDGGLSRLRESLMRLQPHAEQVMLSSLSYDPFAPGRLKLVIRLVPLRPSLDLRLQLLSQRPVTVSQLVATALLEAQGPKDAAELEQRALELLAPLEGAAAVEIELKRNPRRAVRRALGDMRRRGLVVDADGRLELTASRQDPRFEHVQDMVTYQARHFSETLDSLRELKQLTT